jgi:isoleucyl-tRNA synthetase
MSFKKVDPKQNFSKMEEEVLKFWEENKIFEKSVEKNSADKPFIFYEGPPTANGKPGLHHVLARAFKDAIPRYKTMKGFRVERKAGWDTHGLPVELQVEKALGLKNKQDIENIVPGDKRQSIIEFNKKCKESVWEYKDLWEKLTVRMGYWVDMQNPYVTYENKYIESVWWTVAKIFKAKNDKGESLVYKGHKVIPYCYRCGTALSSHEVAQGYQVVKDNSVYIKFKAKPNPEKGIDDNTYFLAWTTTPWTLPGNVALAVGKDIDYVKITNASEKIILSKSIFDEWLKDNSTTILQYYISALPEDKNNKFDYKEIKGKNLLDLEYEPLYEIENKENKKSHYIISGNFVTTTDGTGIVHIAPAFGEDDANVGKENDLPTLLTVDDEGKIIAGLGIPGEGIPVKKKDGKGKFEVDELIMEDLKKRGLFFKEEIYEHEYPFCWRCDTPLIYYAKPSWFIRMSELSEDLVKNNENINWIPEHIKEGRFGEWLRGVKDWAISRERYWGTPLPLWQCECGEIKVVESADEMREQLGNLNKLFFIRHGEAENGVKNIMSCLPEKEISHLTENGKEAIEKIAAGLKDKKIDIIFSSPLKRTEESAEIISKAIGAKIIFDDRLQETILGKLNGESAEKWLEKREKLRFDESNDLGVETFSQLRKRTEAFLKEINEKYQEKNIAIVSHGDTIRMLKGICLGRETAEITKEKYPKKAFTAEVFSKPFDLHRPFIDDVKLKCSCGKEMTRTPEVLDVWFDSGSMPLAQFNYPNGATDEDKQKIESGKYFPADFISEAIDQTRGWFYTLHAIANLLWKAGKVQEGRAFKNVICLGHIVDAKGKKMSKSKGNIVDPMDIMNEYSADMLRYFLYTVNQPGMTKKFDVKSIKDVMNRVFRMLWNSYYFFVMYANIDKFKPSKNHELKTTNLLDKWIISELNILIKSVDEKLENYDMYNSAYAIEKFIDNLSNWYIRRSRKRFWKSEDDGDKKAAYETLHYVLVELSKLLAPFCPFMAEEIYRNLNSCHSGLDPESNGILKQVQDDNACSVHLADFPVADEKLIDEKLNQKMHLAREIINHGLSMRAGNKIKVRQPLNELQVRLPKNSELEEDFLSIISEEVNVKKVSIVENIKDTFSKGVSINVLDDGVDSLNVGLDGEITPDLKLEGQAREIIRFIQEMRKEAEYDVENHIKVSHQGAEKVFKKAELKEMIKKETLANSLSEVKMKEFDLEKEFKIEGEEIKIQIKR